MSSLSTPITPVTPGQKKKKIELSIKTLNGNKPTNNDINNNSTGSSSIVVSATHSSSSNLNNINNNNSASNNTNPIIITPPIEDDLSSLNLSQLTRSLPPINSNTNTFNHPNTLLLPISKTVPMKNDDDATITSTGTWKFQDVAIRMEGMLEKGELSAASNSSNEVISSTPSSKSPFPNSSPDDDKTQFPTSTPRNKIVFEDLKIIRGIGAGSSASVKKVKHIPTNQSYALKIMPTDNDLTKPKVIVAEVKTLYECDCPYIVSLKDAFYRDGCINIVLEYMDYGSVQDLINRYVIRKKKKLPEEVLFSITIQVLKGMEYLHQCKRVIHRDIKPANILLNSKGEVKLTDFGMAGKAQNTLAQRDTFQGTITYMSPERIRGEPHSFDSDIWSIGLTLAQCALGYFPYKCIQTNSETDSENTGFFDLLDEITQKDKVDLPEQDTSAEFREFVWACMRKNPSERPSASELLNSSFVKKFINKKFDLGEWLKKHLPKKKKSDTK